MSESNLVEEAPRCLEACRQQKSIVEERIEQLKEVRLPLAEQALQDMDDIPIHDTACLDKATFIDTLCYLKAVKERQEAKKYYNSNVYRVCKTLSIWKTRHMDELQFHNLTALQARQSKWFGREPEEQAQQIVEEWMQCTYDDPSCQQWRRELYLCIQEVDRRKDEQNALEKRARELQELSQDLLSGQLDQHGQDDVQAIINGARALCKPPSSYAQRASKIVAAVSTDDGVEKNGLPFLGEDLDQFDKRLRPRIKEVNRHFEHMRDLQKALTANPACLDLKKEFDECYSALKESTEELTHFIKEEYEVQGTLYLLMSRQNYTEFTRSLTGLYNTLTPWYQSSAMPDIPLQKHFADLKDRCAISAFNMMGEAEPARDPRTQQALNITNDAFNRALQRHSVSGGSVKITKKFNGYTVYEFESQTAKQRFIIMALEEQSAQDREEQHRRQNDTSDVAAAREEEETPSLSLNPS